MSKERWPNSAGMRSQSLRGTVSIAAIACVGLLGGGSQSVTASVHGQPKPTSAAAMTNRRTAQKVAGSYSTARTGAAAPGCHSNLPVIGRTESPHEVGTILRRNLFP